MLTEIESRPLVVAWIPLSVLLTFAVWRQYRNYCLPVQYYRPEPESDREEGVTLAITFVLALFTFICVSNPYWSYAPFAAIIILNLWKLRQIKNVLLSAPRPPSAAISDLQVFARHLWIYLLFLVPLFFLAMGFDTYLGETAFVNITALVPLLIYSVAQWAYREFSPESKIQIRTRMTPKQYIESVALAFDTSNYPK